jgi:HD-like signal output (HDOD) protein
MSELGSRVTDPVATATENESPEGAAARMAAEREAADKQAEARAAAELAELRAAQEAEEAAVRATRLKRLMQRVAAHADFASMRDSIQGIQKVARSEKSHVRALTAEIAEDVAITGKLLRLINAAFYSSVGGGSITSMKRAVDLMGFQSIGMLASSLVLFERLPKHSDGDRLRQEFGRAQFAAMLAHEMCNSRKHIDGAYMTALFQNLGGMLGGMHFPEEIKEIEAKLDASGLAPEDPAWADAKERLARQHWGIGIEEIGIEVAAQWGWPETLRMSLRSLRPSDNQRAANSEEYLRVLCTAANQLAGDLLRLPNIGTPEDCAAARKACVERFAADMAVPLGLSASGMVDMVESTKLEWDDLAKTLGFGAAQSAPKATPAAKPQALPPAKASPPAMPAAPRPPVRIASATPAVAEALASALEKASELALSGAPRSQLLQLCMKTMYDTLQLQRVILCLRDPQSGGLYGKMGLGDRAAELAAAFVIPMQPPSDLFGLLCLKNADTLISDTADPVIAKRLPAWYKQVRAQTFLLLPMVAGTQVLGALYGDQAQAGRLVLGDREMSLLKTLRNQVVMAVHFGANGGT